MASKKIKKAIGAALIGMAGAKMLGAAKAKKDALKAAQVDTGDFGSEFENNYRNKKMNMDMAVKGANKAKNAYRKSSASMLNYGDAFGLGAMDGAKSGKMIKAKNGVMARGCKLGRNKRTIIT